MKMLATCVLALATFAMVGCDESALDREADAIRDTTQQQAEGIRDQSQSAAEATREASQDAAESLRQRRK